MKQPRSINTTEEPPSIEDGLAISLLMLSIAQVVLNNPSFDTFTHAAYTISSRLMTFITVFAIGVMRINRRDEGSDK